MQKRTLLNLAALSATCLLPITGALAYQNDTTTTDQTTNTSVSVQSGSVQDVEQFRGTLQRVRDLFSQIRENNRLALAAHDPMIYSHYQDDNRGLLVYALSALDQVTRNWQSAEIPGVSGQTADASNLSMGRLGTANLVRYANESDDTAFVRNAVWQLQDRLNSDKLNGRDPMITNRMMSLLDAAIARAENPSFKLAQNTYKSRVAENIHLSSPDDIKFTEPPARTPSTEESTTTTNQNTTESTTTTPPSNETAENTAPSGNVNENTTESANTNESMNNEERTGAANLPKTGGDPSLLFLFGSGLAGLGTLIRKRR